jgi:hypothetical protein
MFGDDMGYGAAIMQYMYRSDAYIVVTHNTPVGGLCGLK